MLHNYNLNITLLLSSLSAAASYAVYGFVELQAQPQIPFVITQSQKSYISTGCMRVEQFVGRFPKLGTLSNGGDTSTGLADFTSTVRLLLPLSASAAE
jgi:hypothetical protein